MVKSQVRENSTQLDACVSTRTPRSASASASAARTTGEAIARSIRSGRVVIVADPRTQVAVLSALPLHRDVLVGTLAPRLPSIHLIASDGPVAEADILLVDVELPGGEALIASAGVPVVLWGGYLHAGPVEELRARGVTYYVSALATPDQVASAVVRAARGPHQHRVEPGPPAAALTERQVAVLRAYVEEYCDLPRREVARRLEISERTLKVHLAAIRAALGGESVSTRTALRRIAVARGLVDTPRV